MRDVRIIAVRTTAPTSPDTWARSPPASAPRPRSEMTRTAVTARARQGDVTALGRQRPRAINSDLTEGGRPLIVLPEAPAEPAGGRACRRSPPRTEASTHMSDSGGPLAVGLKYSRTVAVTDEMTPAHLRQEPIRVLSTPDMVRLVEQTAIEAVARHLAAGQATVGTRV